MIRLKSSTALVGIPYDKNEVTAKEGVSTIAMQVGGREFKRELMLGGNTLQRFPVACA